MPVTDRIDPSFVQELLYGSEGVDLDFKRDQYPFEGADDSDKAELLKDILAFANAFRRSDAYILIGVEEVTGARANVVGVTTHLPDADLPVWQLFLDGQTRVYLDPIDGRQLLRRSPDNDFVLWLRYLHTHLLGGKTGESLGRSVFRSIIGGFLKR